MADPRSGIRNALDEFADGVRENGLSSLDSLWQNFLKLNIHIPYDTAVHSWVQTQQ